MGKGIPRCQGLWPLLATNPSKPSVGLGRDQSIGSYYRVVRNVCWILLRMAKREVVTREQLANYQEHLSQRRE
jgi:hypothetical protein